MSAVCKKFTPLIQCCLSRVKHYLMFLTKAKSAYPCDMGIWLILPVDTDDVVRFQILPDVRAQGSTSSQVRVCKAGFMTTPSFFEGICCDTHIGFNSRCVLSGHCALILDLVYSALAWKWTHLLVPTIRGVLLRFLLGIQDLVVVL